MTYITYECTVCRRQKSIVRDNERAVPNQCLITKGCAGRLLPVNETSLPLDTSPLVGVDDWYPRGETKSHQTAETQSQNFTMSTSAGGALTIAVKSSDEASLPTELNLKVDQKRVATVNFQQFRFKVLTDSSTVSGKDINGKNLRIDQTAIDGRLVIVKVNGVVVFPQLTINSLTFSSVLSAGTIVDVLILSDSLSVPRTITLTRNKYLIPSLGRGSWSNIDYVDRIENDGTSSRWYLFSVDSISGLDSGKIRISRNDVSPNAVFLLSSTPFQSTDRYLNFQIKQSAVSSDFTVSHESGRLVAPSSAIEEIFPPFEIPTAAYLSSDFFTTTTIVTGAIDTTLGKITSKKILGPV